MTQLTDLLKELERFSIKGEFILAPNLILSDVCNIPNRNHYSGVYLFFDDQEMIYVGISGREGPNGEIIHRKDGLRGRFLSGKQFGDRRSRSLPKQMMVEGIKHLRIKWYVTYGEHYKIIPRHLERLIIEAYKIEHFGIRPRWNKKD